MLTLVADCRPLRRRKLTDIPNVAPLGRAFATAVTQIAGDHLAIRIPAPLPREMTQTPPLDVDSFLAMVRRRPRRRKLKPYTAVIMELHDKGATLRDTAEYLNKAYDVEVSFQAIGKFVKARGDAGKAAVPTKHRGPISAPDVVSAPQEQRGSAASDEKNIGLDTQRTADFDSPGLKLTHEHVDPPLAGADSSFPAREPNRADSGGSFATIPSPTANYDSENGSEDPVRQSATGIPVIVQRIDIDRTRPDYQAARDKRQLSLMTGRPTEARSDHNLPTPRQEK